MHGPDLKTGDPLVFLCPGPRAVPPHRRQLPEGPAGVLSGRLHQQHLPDGGVLSSAECSAEKQLKGALMCSVGRSGRAGGLHVARCHRGRRTTRKVGPDGWETSSVRSPSCPRVATLLTAQHGGGLKSESTGSFGVECE